MNKMEIVPRELNFVKNVADLRFTDGKTCFKYSINIVIYLFLVQNQLLNLCSSAMNSQG